MDHAQGIVNALETLLRQAARTTDWERTVVHRCAWCARVATPEGSYDEPAPSAIAAVSPAPLTAITTDGMCPDCAAVALERIRRRPRIRATTATLPLAA